MSTLQEKRNPAEYFLIETRTRATAEPEGKNPGREWVDMDFTKNEDFAQLAGMDPKELESLGDANMPAALRRKAMSYHDKSHLTQEVFQYKTEKGLIWIPANKPEDAKRIFKALKKIDKEIDWNEMGLKLTEEELNAPDAPKSSVPQPKVKK